MVNDYIKAATQGEFSSKDFRTWSASVEALKCLICFDEVSTQKEIKANIVSVLDQVSSRLGNTRTVCKKILRASIVPLIYTSKITLATRYQNQLSRQRQFNRF
jgi:DNA topoisomerase-1